MDYLEKVLENFQEFGKKELSNGSILLAEAKFIAPKAYVHSIFRLRENDNNTEIEKMLGIKLPHDLGQFYSIYNGVNLFNGALSIYGNRNNSIRSVEEAQGQPFSIRAENRRIKEFLVIGSYNWDGSLIKYDLHSFQINLTSKVSGDIKFRWDSFKEFLESEIERLKKLHTKEGKNIPYRPTVPIGGKEVLERMINKERKVKPYWLEDTLKFIKDHDLTINELYEM